jgi:hypothetical protein
MHAIIYLYLRSQQTGAIAPISYDCLSYTPDTRRRYLKNNLFRTFIHPKSVIEGKIHNLQVCEVTLVTCDLISIQVRTMAATLTTTLPPPTNTPVPGKVPLQVLLPLNYSH